MDREHCGGAAEPDIDGVAELIRIILGSDAEVDAQTRLEANLQLESVDVLILDELLRERYGDGVALCDHIARLDFAAILQLSVGDVAAYVERVRR